MKIKIVDIKNTENVLSSPLIKCMLENNALLGEFGIVTRPYVDLTLATHRICDIKSDFTGEYADIEILDTPEGRLVKQYIDNGVKMVLKPRKLGNTDTILTFDLHNI